MLTPAVLLTNRKRVPAWWLVWTASAGLLLATGCTPAGPRALLKGERLMQEGRYSEAIERFQTATRLMPKNAPAWNYLGLAYHGNRQLDLAVRAYRQALALDHTLSPVRFNLGCLYLEQTNLVAAIEELTAFSLANPASTEGWLKLGAATLRARRVEEAEKCFRTVLETQPLHPEALNGLGLVAWQRRRTLDALGYFQRALTQNSNYAPALLNLAVLNQQSLNNRPKAFQFYKQYLGVQPRPADWQAVEQIAAALEREIAPVSIKPASPALALQPVTKTNEPPRPAPPPAPETNTSFMASLKPVVRSNPPTPTPRTIVPAPPAPVTASIKPPSPSNPPPVVAAQPTPPKPPPPESATVAPTQTSAPPVQTSAPPVRTSSPPELQVTHLAGDLIVQPAQELTSNAKSGIAPAPGPPAQTASANPGPPALTDSPAKPEKPGILAKINPFKGKSKSPGDAAGKSAATGGGGVFLTADGSESEKKPPEQTWRTFERYAALSPGKPGAGNRADAERFLKRGFTAHQAGRWSQAISEYQQAIRADPSYFEAYYNLGLAAQESRDYKRALHAYEYALAIDPRSTDARYNFALALKQADYPLDAADQLTALSRDTPTDVRIHLLLGNIYALQLNQPTLAREHYNKVLELNPQHPEAGRIRYWMAANP